MALGNNKVFKAPLLEFLIKFGCNLTVIVTVRISIYANENLDNSTCYEKMCMRFHCGAKFRSSNSPHTSRLSCSVIVIQL